MLPMQIITGVYVHHYQGLTHKSQEPPSFMDKERLIPLEKKWGEKLKTLLEDVDQGDHWRRVGALLDGQPFKGILEPWQDSLPKHIRTLSGIIYGLATVLWIGYKPFNRAGRTKHQFFLKIFESKILNIFGYTINIKYPDTEAEVRENFGYSKFEGHSAQLVKQVDFLKHESGKDGVRNILEIGFNAGHSSDLFLRSSRVTRVTSFDRADYYYVRAAKCYIELEYPGRHKLIIGDSKHTLPQYAFENRGRTFDIIFIGSRRDYETALSDLNYCKEMSNDETLIIIDDTIRNPEWVRDWNGGPVKAWSSMIDQGLIIEQGHVDCRPGRGFSWGRYAT
jgi:predicted O-methyltransferase YrrM